jgi:hypothetical protein
MSKVFEFIGFNVWLLACTGIAAGVFLMLARLIKSAQFPETVEGVLLWAICLPAFVGTWYFVGSRTLRLVQAYYDRRAPKKH